MYQPFFEIENPQPSHKKKIYMKKKYYKFNYNWNIFIVPILGWLEARLMCYLIYRQIVVKISIPGIFI